MTSVTAWALVVFVGPAGTEVTAWLAGPGCPDLGAVDALARAQLLTRRLGGSIRLREVCPELEELLVLVGLRREVGGQAEGGEEGFGVEEEVGPGDPVA